MSTSTPDKVTAAEQQEIDKLAKLVSNFDSKVPIYTMWYRRGNRPPEVKNFQLDAPLQKAILRSRVYCEKMGYRFCGTHPFLIDLDKEEKAHEDGTYLPERV